MQINSSTKKGEADIKKNKQKQQNKQTNKKQQTGVRSFKKKNLNNLEIKGGN